MQKIVENKYTLINTETGECYPIDDVVYKKHKAVPQSVIEKMIDDANSIKELDIDILYSYLRRNGELNAYHQIKLKKMWCKDELFNIATNKKEILLMGYFFNSFKYINKWTNVIYNLEGTQSISNWTELYSLLDIKDNNLKPEFKKFCIKHDLIRLVKIETSKGTKLQKMIINPFLFRARQYTGLLSVIGYKDLCKSEENMSKIMYVYLKIGDLI